MSYEYSDPAREDDAHALPDVEIFQGVSKECRYCGAVAPADSGGNLCDECGQQCKVLPGPVMYWYAFGFPGCLHDSEPSGPFESHDAALAAAREAAGDE